MFSKLLFKRDMTIYMSSNGFNGLAYSVCIWYGGEFIYVWILHGDSISLFRSWAPFRWVQFVRDGQEIYAVFTVWYSCFCAIVLKVVKLQVISGCSKQNIFILVYKIFQYISLQLSRLMDTLFTNLLNINITQTCTEGIKSSDDEEFGIFKLKLA